MEFASISRADLRRLVHLCRRQLDILDPDRRQRLRQRDMHHQLAARRLQRHGDNRVWGLGPYAGNGLYSFGPIANFLAGAGCTQLGDLILLWRHYSRLKYCSDTDDATAVAIHLERTRGTRDCAQQRSGRPCLVADRSAPARARRCAAPCREHQENGSGNSAPILSQLSTLT